MASAPKARFAVRFVLGALTAAAVAVALVLVIIVVDVHRAVDDGRGREVRIEVTRGMSFGQIVGTLRERGLVRREWPLRAYARLRGWERRVQSGMYAFSVGERPVDLLDRMVRGDILRIPVTIPEGMTTWEIAGAFTRAGIDSVAMFSATRDAEACADLGLPVASLEGYLFPDTYQVPFNATPAEVVTQMLVRLEEIIDDRALERAQALGMNTHAVLTLASIVEAEARVDGERSLIAAVYHNRLRRGMRLEADPTVAYAMGGFRGRLLYKDLEIDSPYNTYRHAGLPPGPICSPGEASINATLYPDTATTALYFVARGDGSHIFSRTLREHEAAIRDIRRARPRP